MPAAPKSVDDYLASLPQPHKRMLVDLRKRIKKIVPYAEETISYRMPTFKLNGRMLISLAAFKNHCSLLPGAAIRSLSPEVVKDFKGGKGTLQFTEENPIPEKLLEKILQMRIADLKKK